MTSARIRLPALLLTDAEPTERARPARRTARDWMVDTTAFVLAVTLGALAFADVLQTRDSTVVVVLDLCLGGWACLALWWRRRWPVALAVAVAPLTAFATTSTGAGLVLLFTVAVHRRFTVTAVVAALHAVAGIALVVLTTPPGESAAADIIVTVLVLGVVTAWGMWVRARRQLVLSLRERARQAEAEAELRIEKARHRERERIAREMHDVLAHRISLVSVHANALEYRPDAPPDDLARAAAVIRSSAHQALQDLREIIGVLRAPDLEDAIPERPQPTLADVPALIDECRQAGTRIGIVDRRAGSDEPPARVGRCAYRIVQEGLTNARKHAFGATVTLTLAGGLGAGLTVELRNHVPAATRRRSRIPGAGTGLIGLGERVALAGGRFEHGLTDGGEFRLFAWLPWT